MIETTKQLDMHAYAEKRKKYGDPNKNLAITGFFIIAIAIFVGIFVIKDKITTTTDKNIKYFPANTHFYVDVNLDNKNNNNNVLNETAAETAIKFFDNKYNFLNTAASHKRIVEAFGNEFSFGKWYENINGKDYEIKLVILPSKSYGKATAVLSQLLDKKEKFNSRVYRGYKITYFGQKRWVFMINNGNLYLSNNVIALKYIIDRNIIKKSKGMRSNEKVKKTLSMMQRYRVATVILNTSKKTISITDNENLNKILKVNYSMLPKTSEPLATSVFSSKNGVFIRSFTNVDIPMLHNTPEKKVFCRDKH